MKAIHLTILIITLLAVASATTTKNHQGALRGKNSGHILRKTNLGRALLNMVEMYSRNKNSSMDDLFNALALLKQNLMEKKDHEATDFAAAGTTHQSEVDRLQGRVITYTNDLNTLNNEAAVLASELLNLQGQLQSTLDQLESENEALVTLESNFNQSTIQFQGTIELLDRALEALDQASLQASSGFTSFAQTHQKSLQELSLTLSDRIQKFTTTRSVMMKPIENIFAQMKAGQVVSQDSISNARDAIANLQGYLDSGLAQTTDEYHAQRTATESLIGSLQTLRNSLQDDQIPATQASIETNAANIEDKQTELNTAETDRDHYQGLLDDENTSWAQRIELHDQLMPQFDSEYNIVVQAENVLNAQNIIA